MVVILLGAGATASWALFMGPIGRAVARWIEARTPQAHGQLMTWMPDPGDPYGPNRWKPA